jgi:hypothetical protein
LPLLIAIFRSSTLLFNNGKLAEASYIAKTELSVALWAILDKPVFARVLPILVGYDFLQPWGKIKERMNDEKLNFVLFCSI